MPNATKKAAKPKAGKPVKPTTVDTTPEPAASTIEYKGRTLAIAKPTGDQLGAYKTVMKQFAAARGKKDPDHDTVMRLLERGQILVKSVLADPMDREWLEDAYLTGDMTLTDSFNILLEAADSWGADTTKVKAVKARRVK